MPRDVRKPGGGEPQFYAQLKAWAREVNRELRLLQNRVGILSAAGVNREQPQPWRYPLGFRGAFANEAEYSDKHDLVIEAGRVHTPTGITTVATVDVPLPVSGDLFVYVQITLSTAAATIQTATTLPNFRSGYNTANWPIGRLEETSTGIWLWHQYYQGDINLMELAATGEYGSGFWGEIQSESSGVYSGDVLDRDGSTDTGANFSNASEVHGRAGIKVGSIVWVRPTNDQSGSDDYVFDYHGDPTGSIDVLSEGTIGSPSSDNWNRASQGSKYGVRLPIQCRTRVDASTGEIYEITRNHEATANGHEEIWGAESETLRGVGTPSTETYPYYACSDGTTVVARFAFEDLPDNLAEWVHDGSNFVDASRGAISAGAATSPVPCIVSKAGGASVCGDLSLADFSDDFADNSLDTCKWDSVVENNGSHAETGGNAVFTTASSGTDEDVRIIQTSFPDIGSDDFIAIAKFTISAFDTGTGNAAGAWFNFFIAGASYDIFKAYIAGSADYRIRGRINDSFQTDVISDSNTTIWFRIRRASGTIYLDYDNGGGGSWTNFASGSQSATPTEVFVGALHQSPAASMTVTCTEFTIS